MDWQHWTVWQDWNAFLHMGGYALYVWVSFGVTFGAMALEVLLLRARKASPSS
jgi:heme exporter protein D